jgi:hypothetical protein
MKCAYKMISKKLTSLSTFAFTFTIGFDLRDITQKHYYSNTEDLGSMTLEKDEPPQSKGI